MFSFNLPAGMRPPSYRVAGMTQTWTAESGEEPYYVVKVRKLMCSVPPSPSVSPESLCPLTRLFSPSTHPCTLQGKDPTADQTSTDFGKQQRTCSRSLCVAHARRAVHTLTPYVTYVRYRNLSTLYPPCPARSTHHACTRSGPHTSYHHLLQSQVPADGIRRAA